MADLQANRLEDAPWYAPRQDKIRSEARTSSGFGGPKQIYIATSDFYNSTEEWQEYLDEQATLMGMDPNIGDPDAAVAVYNEEGELVRHNFALSFQNQELCGGCIDRDGNTYQTCFGNDRIVMHDIDGVYVRDFHHDVLVGGLSGDEYASLGHNPESVFAHPETGLMYVGHADGQTHIAVYDRETGFPVERILDDGWLYTHRGSDWISISLDTTRLYFGSESEYIFQIDMTSEGDQNVATYFADYETYWPGVSATTYHVGVHPTTGNILAWADDFWTPTITNLSAAILEFTPSGSFVRMYPVSNQWIADDPSIGSFTMFAGGVSTDGQYIYAANYTAYELLRWEYEAGGSDPEYWLGLGYQDRDAMQFDLETDGWYSYASALYQGSCSGLFLTGTYGFGGPRDPATADQNSQRINFRAR